MEIAFASLDLRILCEKPKKAEQRLGEEVARVLRRRLADMRAAGFVADLPVGRPREKKSGPDSFYVIDLVKGAQIVFKSNHNRTPMRVDKSVDWANVYRIQILSIGDEDE